MVLPWIFVPFPFRICPSYFTQDVCNSSQAASCCWQRTLRLALHRSPAAEMSRSVVSGSGVEQVGLTGFNFPSFLKIDLSSKELRKIKISQFWLDSEKDISLCIMSDGPCPVTFREIRKHQNPKLANP